VENADVSHEDSRTYYCWIPLNSGGNYPDTGGPWRCNRTAWVVL